MKAVVHRILENNLTELKGLSIEGEIPVTEEFLNELIGIFLENSNRDTFSGQSTSTASAGGIDFTQILNALDKKEIKLELREKQAILKIDAKKY